MKIKLLHPDAEIPKYQTCGAACFDIAAVDAGTRHPTDCRAMIYRTGIAVEAPPGYALMIYSRSGHGFKHGIRLSNCAGIIDSDYRGEIMVSLGGDGCMPAFKMGDRIAQAMLIPVQQVQFEVVNELSETDRGACGFGSTS